MQPIVESVPLLMAQGLYAADGARLGFTLGLIPAPGWTWFVGRLP